MFLLLASRLLASLPAGGETGMTCRDPSCCAWLWKASPHARCLGLEASPEEEKCSRVDTGLPQGGRCPARHSSVHTCWGAQKCVCLGPENCGCCWGKAAPRWRETDLSPSRRQAAILEWRGPGMAAPSWGDRESLWLMAVGASHDSGSHPHPRPQTQGPGLWALCEEVTAGQG